MGRGRGASVGSHACRGEAASSGAAVAQCTPCCSSARVANASRPADSQRKRGSNALTLLELLAEAAVLLVLQGKGRGCKARKR